MPQPTYVPRLGGNASKLNVTAATVIKATPGTVMTVCVTTAGTTTGAIYDAATTSGNTAANLIGVIPEAIGTYVYTFPCFTGILVVPGTSQVCAVAFE